MAPLDQHNKERPAKACLTPAPHRNEVLITIYHHAFSIANRKPISTSCDYEVRLGLRPRHSIGRRVRLLCNKRNRPFIEQCDGLIEGAGNRQDFNTHSSTFSSKIAQNFLIWYLLLTSAFYKKRGSGVANC
ncbi:hypothetical protein MHIR_DE00401 [Candidatus Doolittlea endobia]|uniref:Uncharacterized protein n=1 Tax=Candidatus Doolittlea endobia TaxID=1778262 RepID=A0A143WSK4_9ENTR|nr:hypothetical protein MHIR_DE00401 [Candidatus Doolittlea endobia]